MTMAGKYARCYVGLSYDIKVYNEVMGVRKLGDLSFNRGHKKAIRSTVLWLVKRVHGWSSWEFDEIGMGINGILHAQ